MRPRTILIAAGASLLLLLLLRPWAGGTSTTASPPRAVAAREVPRGLPLRDAAADRVRAELAELRADVSRLGAAPVPKDVPSPEEAQARYEQRVATQTALLVQAFAADGRDPSWSPQTERVLRDAFAAAPPPGARLEEVMCGARLCRVTAAFDSAERREEGAGALFGLIRWRSFAFGDASPEDPRRYVLYAARDRESFPRVD